ncbi:ATP-grasp domain-containing protein [Tissierella creatinini]|nr:ATP-grasp domain-containing protein [Tissierella creatinini]TJX66636.1 ATP-grasp domain-containing protein [Soehngenia saccharolytica]
MNFLLISPDFPPNYKYFAIRLKAQGINVLGIGSEFYDNLDKELRDALTEYYRIENMEIYSQLLKACGYFTYKFGKIDRIESHNGYWLEKDALLRTDFNVNGIKKDTIYNLILKSNMKRILKEAGISIAKGRLITTLDDAKSLISDIGYPVIAKPNDGICAMGSYKITDESELMDFFKVKEPNEYIIEEFINGRIQSFDGLTDYEGNIVFYSSMDYENGLMETVSNNLDSVYKIQMKVPDDLLILGKKVVEAFQIRERFFHIEFFRMEDNRLIVMEVNARPPGGYNIDEINYAYDIDLYNIYANVVNGKKDFYISEPKYYCAYVGLKTHKIPNLVHSLEEVLNNYGHMIAFHGLNPPLFESLMGNYVIIFKAKDEQSLKEALDYTTLRD